MEIYWKYLVVWKNGEVDTFYSETERNALVYHLEMYGYEQGEDFLLDQRIISEEEYFGWN